MIDYTKALSGTVRAIQPSGIRKFFDIANTMEGVISLGVGEPDFRTPWQVRSAGIRSLEKGSTRYTANRGLDALRLEIAKYTERKYGMKYDHESEILVTVGGSEAIDMALRALIDPGDEVIIPEPSYVCYVPLTRLCGGVPVIVKTTPATRFKLTPEALAATYVAGGALKDGKLVTSGGRVTGTTAVCDSLPEAIKEAYRLSDGVKFEGAYRRSDIGQRALQALK